MLLSLAIAATLSWARPALAYVRSQTSSGACLWWGQRIVPFMVNQDGSDDVTDGSDIDAVKKSFATWTAVACSDFTYQYDGVTSRRDIGYDRTASDNVNLVVWREQSCQDVVPSNDQCWNCADTGGLCCDRKYNCWEHPGGIIAVTTTTFNTTTGQLYDADIELNGVDYWFTTVDAPQCTDPSNPPSCTRQSDCASGYRCFAGACLADGCVRTDIQNTVTHESGHVLGLDHTPVPDATMYASAPEGELSKRTLANDDIQGLCDMYPTGGPTLTCFGAQVQIQPLQSTDEIRGCGGCSGEGGGGGFLGFGLLLGLWFLRPRH